MNYGQTNWRRPAVPVMPAPRTLRWTKDSNRYQPPALRFGPMPCESRGTFKPFCQPPHRAMIQCFNCMNFGHIARYCNLKRDKSHMGAAPKSTKSERKRARDLKRLIQYKERKCVCAILPFAEVSNDDLPKCVPKFVSHSPGKRTENVATLASALDCANSAVTNLQVENSRLSNQVNALNSTVSSLTETIRCLEDRLTESEQKNQFIREQSNSTEGNLVLKENELSQIREIAEQKDQQIKDLKSQLDLLSADFLNLIKSRNDAQDRLKAKSSECEQLSQEIVLLKTSSSYGSYTPYNAGFGVPNQPVGRTVVQDQTAKHQKPDLEAALIKMDHVLTDYIRREIPQSRQETNKRWSNRSRRGNYR